VRNCRSLIALASKRQNTRTCESCASNIKATPIEFSMHLILVARQSCWLVAVKPGTKLGMTLLYLLLIDLYDDHLENLRNEGEL